jgi:hypothetical protein
MKSQYIFFMTLLLSGLATAPEKSYAASATVSNSLNADIQANGALSVPASTNLTHSGTIFNAFTGTVSLQYRARTTGAGGGSLTMKVIQDFQAGGPSVALGDLKYTCGAAGLGTACSLTTASTTSATGVVTLPVSGCTGGGSPCGGTDPNSVVLTFTLADRPLVKTGSFTANVQFTISAT